MSDWPPEFLRDLDGVCLPQSVDSSGGIDAATAALYRDVVRSGRLLRPTATAADPVTVLVMPGAFHADHPGTGADGRRVVELATNLGCRATVVPVGSFDPIRSNAAALVKLLRRTAGPVMIVSLSKGGADVKAAVAADPGAFAAVRSWVSLSGMTAGTPLVAWLRRRPLRWAAVRSILWWRGYSKSTLTELAADAATPWPPMPSHLTLVRVVGFPLRRHLSHPWAFRGYDRLAPLGPNDGGGLLLVDAVAGPGLVYPVWGADHYLQPTTWDIGPLLSNILATATTGPIRVGADATV